MPKMKTNSSAKKRFKVTGTGKIKRKRAFKRHILTSKENSQKARLSSPALVHPTQEKQVLRMLSQG